MLTSWVDTVSLHRFFRLEIRDDLEFQSTDKVQSRYCRKRLGLLLFSGVIFQRVEGAPTPAVGRLSLGLIQPILNQYCYGCHGNGEKKGNVAFDEFDSDEALLNPDLWLRVLKSLRSGLMPPRNKAPLPVEERKRLESWIKYDAFDIDPKNPYPGRATIRRLNRAEYRNTIRDLVGVNVNTDLEFPPDDAGYGFDNIGEGLTLSTILVEKYLQAASTIISEGVPTAPSADTREKYERFFPRAIPQSATERRFYAKELLSDFAAKAFRHPADDKTLSHLTSLAEGIYTQPNQTFEMGVAQAMVATLASPQFLFREEETEVGGPNGLYPFVDEYSLASRLSYFLWSSLPDEELFHLAGAQKLKENLSAQVARMLADPRSEAFIKNFTGQWLLSRDIETIPIDSPTVLSREERRDPEADACQECVRRESSQVDLKTSPLERKKNSRNYGQIF